MTRFKTKNDKDIQYVLGEDDGILKVYVIVQHSQQSLNVNQLVHAQSLYESNYQSFIQQEWNKIYQLSQHNFVQLMAA